MGIESQTDKHTERQTDIVSYKGAPIQKKHRYWYVAIQNRLLLFRQNINLASFLVTEL